ncbi:hypothetical protein EV193_101491 [Herbihabitans rhizosphaerae]|uniref:Uncharacterized protein n=1 Tax=Herbihabitans rhizosphaerae TaxID=1872711 RepID=A0A4Q7L5K4_9PSEU|nr:hypothetical protein [Herbihabitans rhizosphaerae]RZS44615.1 hypothetical protein EV193_101491 [Herbihabitans rhizosphaerae]
MSSQVISHADAVARYPALEALPTDVHWRWEVRPLGGRWGAELWGSVTIDHGAAGVGIFIYRDYAKALRVEQCDFPEQVTGTLGAAVDAAAKFLSGHR